MRSRHESISRYRQTQTKINRFNESKQIGQTESHRDRQGQREKQRQTDRDIRRQTVAVKEDIDYKNRRRWTETGLDRGRQRQP